MKYQVNIKIKKDSFDYSDLKIPDSIVSSDKNINKLQYNTFGQLISRARLEKKPLVIVEGKDDIPIYEQIAKKNKKNVRVKAIETFDNYSEGCSQVTKFIEEAQEELNRSEENERFLMGIIDRDASFYRNEIKEMKCLFVLKKYSFESHFVTQKNVEFALENFICSSFGINDKVIDYVLKTYNESLNAFYYYSLEALKNACCKNYTGIIGYKKSYFEIINTNPYSTIMNKKEELDIFAKTMKIQEDDYTSIIKGKWLLDLFVEETYKNLLTLSQLCSENNLVHGQERCSFCESGDIDKCSWKPRKKYSKTMYKSFILQFLNEVEMDYIYEEFSKLG